MAQSLEDMAEELTCSICLELFITPVTIPCGHNFCCLCLELTWKESAVCTYSCPQCRCPFNTKPDLKKNTLLSNLVSQLRAARGPEEPETKKKECPPDDVLCDNCMKGAAAKSCLTCMASFCQEHLQPHLHSPAFMDHQLRQPLRDLQQRKCPEHNKLLDHYCWDHSRCICCHCLGTHKTCRTSSLQEGKTHKELHFKNLLRSLNQRIEKTSTLTDEIKREQRQVMDITKKKKDLLDQEYDEIKALIEQEQRKSIRKLEGEQNRVNSKFSYTLSVFDKKKKEFEVLKTKVVSLLQEDDDLQFLKQATKLHDVTSKDIFKPKTEFDEKLLHQVFRSTVSLKETIKTKLAQIDETLEGRPQPTAPKEKASADESTHSEKEWRPPQQTPDKKPKKSKQKMKAPQSPESASDTAIPNPQEPEPSPKGSQHTRDSREKPSQQVKVSGHQHVMRSAGGVGKRWGKDRRRKGTSADNSRSGGNNGCISQKCVTTTTVAIWQLIVNRPRNHRKQRKGIMLPRYPRLKESVGSESFRNRTPAEKLRDRFRRDKKVDPERSPNLMQLIKCRKSLSVPVCREDVMMYAEWLTVDPSTAHKRVILSERDTKLTVSDNPQNYVDLPQRFTHCSQALCSKGFDHGIHYWEVDIEGGHFSGIGIAYQSIARKGPESRLGRNKVSWCIEYFNGKLQAWHDEKETNLTTPNATKIGVLLNYEEGLLSFFSAAKKFSQIFRFRAQFIEPVYPAFWVFSSNTILSISNLK
ncbi:E3 ubiquitin/ISG15 ligase TRIM25-like [Rhinophrynus dorsalis]